MKKESGFTLVEVVVVVLVILVVSFFILSNLLPHGTREMPNRVKCGSQLNGIGKAMAIYQNDYNDANPIAAWDTKTNQGQFGMGLYDLPGENKYTRWYDPNFKDWDKEPTVGGCLWLLIKYADLCPEMFLCPSDPCAREMDITVATTAYPDRIKTWADLNDFQYAENLSYSYNDPWKVPITAASSGAMVVMADKSPAYIAPGGKRNPQAGDFPTPQGEDWMAKNNPRAGSSPNHPLEAQNVLFADSHVKFHKKPTVGIEDDNIYTRWSRSGESAPWDKRIGRWDQGHAAAQEDAYLGN